MEQLLDFLFLYRFEISLFVTGAGYLLITFFSHLFSDRFDNTVSWIVFAVALIGLPSGFVLLLLYPPEPIPFTVVSAILFAWGALLFVLLSDLLILGLADFLTARRGEKWVKEMDYVYLAMGSVGILFSINRFESLTSRFEKADVFAPLILATAIVIRAVKTRAEIGEWNKRPTTKRGFIWYNPEYEANAIETKEDTATHEKRK